MNQQSKVLKNTHIQTNQYPGKCCRCGEIVPAGEGELAEVTSEEKMAWGMRFMRNCTKVQHLECRDRWEGTTRHYFHNPEGA